jgi:hypothetical protein
LTARRRLIYGGRCVRIRQKLHLRLQVCSGPCRVALCLTLVALFLYNPFLTIYGASPVVNIQHPLSYRATIASSELRRCTVEPAKPLVPALQAAAAFELTQSAATDEAPPVLPRDLFRAVPQVICGSLWFRPPPIL